MGQTLITKEQIEDLEYAPIRYIPFIISSATNLSLTHENNYGRCTSTTTYTITPNSTTAFPIGGRIDILILDTVVLTFVAGAGVTISKKTNLVATGWVGVTLIKTDTNTWDLIGN